MKVPVPQEGKGIIYLHGFTTDMWRDSTFIPPFVLAPREATFKMTQVDHPQVCHALLDAISSALDIEAKVKGCSQKRGKGRVMFGDDPRFVSANLGPKAKQFEPGVSDNSYHVNHMDPKVFKRISCAVCKMENIRNYVLPYHVVHNSFECMK